MAQIKLDLPHKIIHGLLKQDVAESECVLLETKFGTNNILVFIYCTTNGIYTVRHRQRRRIASWVGAANHG